MNKEQFMETVTKDVIQNLKFVPTKDHAGNMILGSSLNILQKNEPGLFSIVQIVDADIIGELNIRRRIEQTEDMIKKAIGSFSGRISAVLVLVYNTNIGIPFESVYESSSHITILKVTLNNKIVLGYAAGFPANAVSEIVQGRLSDNSDDTVHLNIDDILRDSYTPQATPRPKIKKPYVTYTFIIINVVIWLLAVVTEQFMGANIVNLFGIKWAPNIIAGEYWRLITPMFLHADIMHLGGNSFSLYIFGEAVEEIVGHGKFAVIYLMSGIVGNIASFAMVPHFSLGASGAVLGVGGALVYIWLKNRETIRGNRGQYLTLVFMVFLNIAYGFTNPGIDNFAHLGGAIGGFLLAGILGQKEYRTSVKNRVIMSIFLVALTFIGLFIGFYRFS